MWFENRITYNYINDPILYECHVFSPNNKRKFSFVDKICLLILLIKNKLLFRYHMIFNIAGFDGAKMLDRPDRLHIYKYKVIQI